MKKQKNSKISPERVMGKKMCRTMILASFIESLLGNYSTDERTATWLMFKRRIEKGMHKQRQLYRGNFIENLILSGKIWGEAVDYFAEEKITIEASYSISEIAAKDPNGLKQHYGIDKQMLEKFYNVPNIDDVLNVEKDSRRVATRLFELTSNALGLEVQHKDNSKLKAMVAAAKERKDGGGVIIEVKGKAPESIEILQNGERIK